MKKALIFIIAAALMLSLPCINVFAAYSADLTVSSVSAETGETAEVTISIANNPGLCALGFEIEYDSTALQVVSAEYTELFGVSAQKVNTAGQTVVFNIAKADNVTANGVVAKITFRVLTGTDGNYAITPKLRADTGFVLHSAEDRSLHDVELKLTAGTVTVTGNGTVTDTPVTDTPVTDASGVCNHSQTVKETLKPASCDEKGILSVKCAACGAVMGEEELPALEHQWGEWVTKTEPTEKTEGKAEQSCALCGAVNEKALEKLPADSTTAPDSTAPATTPSDKDPEADNGNAVAVILIIVAVLAVAALVFFAVTKMKKEKQEREKDFL